MKSRNTTWVHKLTQTSVILGMLNLSACSISGWWSKRCGSDRLAWSRSVWMCWSKWVTAKVSGFTCWPLQIDLIKNMAAPLFRWNHKGQRDHQREKRREKKRTGATCNQNESEVKLINELLICIEIEGIQIELWSSGSGLIYESRVRSSCSQLPHFIRICLSFQYWPYSRP